MKSSSAVREQIETALARRVPQALTPRLRTDAERLPTGVAAIDAITAGGLPVGAVTEMVGVEGSGRTTLAMRFIAARMAEGGVCAWVDATDGLDPESVAGAGVDPERMLWVRCGQGEVRDDVGDSAMAVGLEAGLGRGRGGVSVDGSISVPAPSGGCGSPHPRNEGRGLPAAIADLLGRPGAAEAQRASALLPLRRRDKSIGTPGAVNRAVGGATAFPRRAVDRVEQVASDRLPSRRGGGRWFG